MIKKDLGKPIFPMENSATNFPMENSATNFSARENKLKLFLFNFFLKSYWHAEILAVHRHR